jgi:prepilin-type N-terminal cleavage/methylation domain-containing protein
MILTNRRSRSGLSLLEVVVATAILGMVLFATYAVLYSTSTSSARGQLSTGLDAKGKEFIEYCKSDFRDARFNDTTNSGRIGIHDNGTQVHYQVALGMATSGFVTFGYVGNEHFTGTPTNVIDTGVNITLKGQTKTVIKQDQQAWIDHSCVIRFEPELVFYEGPTAPNILHPGTADGSAPQTWKPNPYLNTTNPNIPPVSQVKDDPLPTWPLISGQPKLNIDINRDGDKTDVFVKGRIWKYVMAPWAGAPIVLHSEVLSDNVILAVAPDGTFRGDVDGVDSQVSLMRKDTLFRYLTEVPSPNGTTDVAQTQPFPGNLTACMGVTIWHGQLDDSGKLFFLRKSWERISFRLTRISGS